LTIGLLLTFSQEGQTKPTFTEYVGQLKEEALSLGYSRPWLDEVFSQVSYRQSTVQADNNQPETKITLDSYLATRVPDWKVQQAVSLMAEHFDLLEQVEQQYGVQKSFIVALWGNESNFGKIMGRHPVLSSLTTLAYDGRREVMFKKQLFAALSILKQGHIRQEDFVGSWAGAMGQSQFMPQSFLDYAVDFNGNGKIDIWSEPGDVFASIANFLGAEGWSDTGTWGRQVTMPDSLDPKLIGLKSTHKKSLAQWQALGVKRYAGTDLPKVCIDANLIAPDGPKGRVYLVYNNFLTLMKWNRSSYFGLSVSYLTDRIKKGK
jgi:membrane-bound lytic murein transglycosylase B